MFFIPGAHRQSGLSHNPFKAIVSPRPIGWISSRGSNSSVNLAPYSYFNAICDQPPMVMFSSTPGGDANKDTLRNILETKEFAVNIVSAALACEMRISSASFPYGINEFIEAGLQMTQCETISVPRVMASPATLECRLWQSIDLPASKDGGNSTVILGSITGIHIADNVIVDGKVSVAAYKPLARLGYNDYAQISDLFEMERP